MHFHRWIHKILREFRGEGVDPIAQELTETTNKRYEWKDTQRP